MKTALRMGSNKNNQLDEHQHWRVLTVACSAVVSPDTLCTAATWGASRNVRHAFYSVAV